MDDDGWLVEMFSEQRLSFCSEDIFFLGLRSFFAACLVFSCFRAQLARWVVCVWFFYASFFALKSLTAARIASSANILQ